jgi:hypothetical protein
MKMYVKDETKKDMGNKRRRRTKQRLTEGVEEKKVKTKR